MTPGVEDCSTAGRKSIPRKVMTARATIIINVRIEEWQT